MQVLAVEWREDSTASQTPLKDVGASIQGDTVSATMVHSDRSIGIVVGGRMVELKIVEEMTCKIRKIQLPMRNLA